MALTPDDIDANLPGGATAAPTLVVFLLLLAGVQPGCAPSRGEPASAVDRLTIGAYSVVREAFHDGVLPAFAADWKRRTGRSVVFEESYNSSGAQGRAIASGFDADLAVLSLESDIRRLVEARMVDPGWDAGPDRGIITRSLVVIGVRPGNPKSIHDWDDLARPGVSVLYPDPKTSGGARWNINAIYGAAVRPSAERGAAAAYDLLASVQANVMNMDSSGRQSMATFERGIGDAVVTYENELRLQRKRTGEDVLTIIPPATLLIEGPAALVDTSVARHGNRAVAEAFLAFLRTPEAQAILADHGFRPIGSDGAPTPRHEPAGFPPLPPHLFTMADLGGWDAVNKAVYGPKGVWDALFTRRSRGTTPGASGSKDADMSTATSMSAATGRTSVRRTSSAVLIRGATLSYLGLMVVLPLVALTLEATGPGWGAFWAALANPFAWHALKLTAATALVMVAINAVTGTATAWVLVRYTFPGKGIMNALIDLPFAVPTVVTGLMLVAFYGPSSVLGAFLTQHGWDVIYQKPGIVLALLFVTYPFVVRSVQPVLLEMDRAEEEAAATLGAGALTTFRRVTLPTLRPAILTGMALSFSRALGEFGSVVMVAGNRPLETRTGPMYIFGEIESGNRHGALVVSVVLLAGSLGILIALNSLQRDAQR